MEWHLDDKKVQWQQQGQVALAIFVTGEFSTRLMFVTSCNTDFGS
jgi:hypothetical protein